MLPQKSSSKPSFVYRLVRFVLNLPLRILGTRAFGLVPCPADVTIAFPLGHFYSPIVTPGELDPAQLWPEETSIPPGLDFDGPGHIRLLTTVFKPYLRDFDYPEHGESDAELTHFYTGNSQFSWLDARACFALLRHWRPARIIEIGSGFSTILTADVNARFLGGTTQILAIEPFPRPFLHALPGVKLLRQRIQDVDIEVVDQLCSGDVLFVDSTHIAKTGSDVNHIVFKLLPRLKPGVFVHFHDIFLPHEYPKDWVLDDNRSWNEQYLLQALLMFNTRFKIVFSSSYAVTFARNELADALGSQHVVGGGSLWLQVTDNA